VKRCRTCGEALPLESFVRDASKPSGLASRCKACHRAAGAARYAAHRGAINRRVSARRRLARAAARPARRAARFWAKVDTSGGPDACWPWTGSVNAKGYGRVRRGDTLSTAHRMAWGLTSGPLPAGLSLCHTCDNPPCCNPAHLFLGTNADNTADMVGKGRQARGERSNLSRLTEWQVRAARARYALGGVSVRALAAETGINRETLRRLLRGHTWKHIA
jgi:HNH endonuclease